MANNFSFSVMPSVSISRSRFARKSQHKTSFNLGDIIPIFCDEVLPGDTRSIDMSALVRMSTPIAPIMDNIYLDYFAFFVPNRIVWDHWKEFQGENNTSAGIPQVQYQVPCAFIESMTVTLGSYADYFGLPVGAALHNKNVDFVSALPFRGLAKIYNRWFRNENLIAPLAVDTSDNDAILVGDGGNFAVNQTLLKASKLPDYFTKCLPYAQKGSAVSIPLGTSAPIRISNDPATGTAVPAGTSLNIKNVSDISGKTGAGSSLSASAISGQYASPVFVDLSQATAATINQLRYAFQLQKLLEKDALYGTRYWEILAAHFGITAPDASLQDPEYLGGRRMHINIDQVLSTAGYDNTASQDVGKVGANSVSGFQGSLFTKSFVEHGYIFIVAVARHDQTYGQGIDRMWSRRNRYDYYMPVFANLGAQAVFKKEIYANGSANDLDVFGYQEAWAEYRYAKSKATNLLNPANTGALKYWTLGTRFGAAPTLGQVFIEQDRTALSDALTTGSDGPDFIADFFFNDIAVRPMPVYSIPGLIDHH